MAPVSLLATYSSTFTSTFSARITVSPFSFVVSVTSRVVVTISPSSDTVFVVVMIVRITSPDLNPSGVPVNDLPSDLLSGVDLPDCTAPISEAMSRT